MFFSPYRIIECIRAKDKDFNATLKTDYDETIGTINIIPQDIGRVILNLITNAFYAVNGQKKIKGEAYEPTLIIATRSISSPSGGRGVEIKVSANGGGVDSAIINKIFQPSSPLCQQAGGQVWDYRWHMIL